MLDILTYLVSTPSALTGRAISVDFPEGAVASAEVTVPTAVGLSHEKLTIPAFIFCFQLLPLIYFPSIHANFMLLMGWAGNMLFHVELIEWCPQCKHCNTFPFGYITHRDHQHMDNLS